MHAHVPTHSLLSIVIYHDYSGVGWGGGSQGGGGGEGHADTDRLTNIDPRDNRQSEREGGGWKEWEGRERG